MQAKTFITGLRATTTVLPFAKKINDDEAQFIWLGLDDQIKREVSDEMWVYACNKRMGDQEPNEKISLVHQILCFVYCVNNGSPSLDWGLKWGNAEDFKLWMSVGPKKFHEIVHERMFPKSLEAA
jgi:hypothetical protein